jgi:hypothetical protein
MKRLIVPLAMIGILFTGCMSVPSGVHLYVTDTGCTSQGFCPWADGQVHDFYYAPTREIVVAPGQSIKVEAHELCHAHQQETIIEETGHEPRGLTLQDWLDTSEGRAYAAVVEANVRPASWRLSLDNTVEDFAEACARYLTHWADQDPARDQFFESEGF